MPTIARRSCSRARSASPSGHRLEQGVEGGLAFAAVEGRRRPRRHPPCARRTRAAIPCGGEVAGGGPRPPPAPRLRPRARGAPGPGPRRCRRGAARVRTASRRESSSPFASSSSAREGTRPSKKLLDFRLRHGADEFVDHLAVAEGLDRRDALDAVARRQRLVGVGVDLGQQDLAAALGLRRLQRRASAAGRARTTRPRSRPRRASASRARPRRARSRFGDVDRHSPRD